MMKWSKSSSIRSTNGTTGDVKFASWYEEADDERQPGKALRMLSSNRHGDDDDVNHQQQQQVQKKMFKCNKCNKVFQSSKALCGHMACHSIKHKSLIKTKHLMIINTHSNTESASKNSIRRSRRNKYNKLDVPVADSITKLDGYSYNNCSSEEVAICLMMLSKDSWRSADNVDQAISKFECKKFETLDDSRMRAKNGTFRAKNQCTNVEMYRRFEHKAGIQSRSHRAFNGNVAVNHQRFKAASTHESEENKCDEVLEIFKGDESPLREFIDLNLPAPLEDQESN